MKSDNEEEDLQSERFGKEMITTRDDASPNKRSYQSLSGVLKNTKGFPKTKDDDEAHFEKARAKDREYRLIAKNKAENELTHSKSSEKKILRSALEHVLQGLLQQIAIFQIRASKAADLKKKREFSNFTYTLKVRFDMDAKKQADLKVCTSTDKIWQAVSGANDLLVILEALTEDTWNRAMKRIQLQKGHNKKCRYGAALLFLFKETPTEEDKPEVAPCCSPLELIKRTESVLPVCKLTFRKVAETLTYPGSATDEAARGQWKTLLFLKMSELDVLAHLVEERTEQSSHELDRMLKNIVKELAAVVQMLSPEEKLAKEVSKLVQDRKRKVVSKVDQDGGSENKGATSRKSEDPIENESNERLLREKGKKIRETEEKIQKKKKVLRESPEKRELRKSSEKGVLRESPKKRELLESPEKRELRESPEKRELRKSPEKRELRNRADQGKVDQGEEKKLEHLEEQNSQYGAVEVCEDWEELSVEDRAEKGTVEVCEHWEDLAVDEEDDNPPIIFLIGSPAVEGNEVDEQEGDDKQHEQEGDGKLDEEEKKEEDKKTKTKTKSQSSSVSSLTKLANERDRDLMIAKMKADWFSTFDGSLLKRVMQINRDQKEELTTNLEKERKDKSDLAKSLEKVIQDFARNLEKADRRKNSEKVLARDLDIGRKSQQELAKNLEKETNQNAVFASSLETANEEISGLKSLLKKQGKAIQELVISLKEEEREKNILVDLLQKKDDSDENWTKIVAKTSYKASGKTSFYSLDFYLQFYNK